MAWTNNDALPCSDGVACTRNDRCSGGVCSGTPFTCLSCEECYNDACSVKPGYCVIQDGGVKKCFAQGTLRPGSQCQVQSRKYLFTGLPVAQSKYKISFFRRKKAKWRMDHLKGIACPTPSNRASYLTFLWR